MADINPSTEFVIHRVQTEQDFKQWIPSLARLLLICVNDDSYSSLGFRAPLSEAKATEYWESLLSSFVGPEANSVLFMLSRASGPGGNAVATVHIASQPKETHAHKVEVRKLLVDSAERGHGLGRKLMDAVEEYAARELGKTLVLLDTSTVSPARAFYLRLGYREWGTCPDYSTNAAGVLHDTSFFYKKLACQDPGC
ncbi:acyl-CoA N-acyltransferase [Stachybotrys elegans]|uniref:Acyl-CoA N-acyltransferase n=1 Tax=Stachybotrys elegans TaxID=80388 RepID=A0A8K0SF15_9HYPO|nr:acyl-CoA N-acyltransferase [Stachybotrys elegans]